MTKRNEGILLVTKLEAVRRQIDAAVRMSFLNEDSLAIHTVASAAYVILRDIKKKRSRSEMADTMKAGLFVVARKIEAGVLKSIPEPLLDSEVIARKIIPSIVESIRRGEVKGPEDIDFAFSNEWEKQHWQEFNATANFLKHADKDPDEFLDLNKINNSFLIGSACRAYCEIMGVLTPEMEMFILSVCASDPAFGPAFSQEVDEELRQMSPSKRRKVLLKYLRELKKEKLQIQH